MYIVNLISGKLQISNYKLQIKKAGSFETGLFFNLRFRYWTAKIKSSWSL